MYIQTWLNPSTTLSGRADCAGTWARKCLFSFCPRVAGKRLGVPCARLPELACPHSLKRTGCGEPSVDFPRMSFTLTLQEERECMCVKRLSH
jgi:hypothetical protein